MSSAEKVAQQAHFDRQEHNSSVAPSESSYAPVQEQEHGEHQWQAHDDGSHHFGDLNGDLPPSYDESQARHIDAPPAVGHNVQVYRTEMPPNPNVPPPTASSSNEKGALRDLSPNSAHSSVLSRALQWTESNNGGIALDPRQASSLARPVAIPSLPSATGPVQFARFYAKILQICDVTPSQFMDFIDGLNALARASNASVLSLQRSQSSQGTAGPPSDALVMQYLLQANQAFFAARGLNVQLLSLSQLAHRFQLPPPARQALFSNVLRSYRVGQEIPAAANGAATSAVGCLEPYIEPLSFSVPEPRVENEGLTDMASQMAAMNLANGSNERAVPPEAGPSNGANPHQQQQQSQHQSPQQQEAASATNIFGPTFWNTVGQGFNAFGQQQGRFWNGFGQQQGRFWGDFGEKQGKYWGSWGEEVGKKFANPSAEPSGCGGGPAAPPGNAREGYPGPGPFMGRGGPPRGGFGGRGGWWNAPAGGRGGMHHAHHPHHPHGPPPSHGGPSGYGPGHHDNQHIPHPSFGGPPGYNHGPPAPHSHHVTGGYPPEKGRAAHDEDYDSYSDSDSESGSDTSDYSDASDETLIGEQTRHLFDLKSAEIERSSAEAMKRGDKSAEQVEAERQLAMQAIIRERDAMMAALADHNARKVSGGRAPRPEGQERSSRRESSGRAERRAAKREKRAAKKERRKEKREDRREARQERRQRRFGGGGGSEAGDGGSGRRERRERRRGGRHGRHHRHDDRSEQHAPPPPGAHAEWEARAHGRHPAWADQRRQFEDNRQVYEEHMAAAGNPSSSSPLRSGMRHPSARGMSGTETTGPFQPGAWRGEGGFEVDDGRDELIWLVVERAQNSYPSHAAAGVAAPVYAQ